MVNTLQIIARGESSIHYLGTKILHAMWLKGKNKNDAKILTAQLYVTLAWK